MASGALPSPVAILRLSGPSAARVLRDRLGVNRLPPLRCAGLRRLRSGAKANTKTSAKDGAKDGAEVGLAVGAEVIDEALVINFGKQSVTGENLIEIHCHGSQAVVDSIMTELLGDSDVRLAQPGEFSRRAFLNGKINLYQAEALADLIDAQTALQARQALDGLLGKTEVFDRWDASLMRVCAGVGAWVEFDESDDLEMDASYHTDLLHQIDALANEMADALKDTRGELVRLGALVVLDGQVNVGKSSLLNRLAGYEAAIVDSAAGTTRDPIEVRLRLGGYLVRLLDTAGTRRARSRVEASGIAKARAASRKSLLKLRVLCFDKTGRIDGKLPSKPKPDELWVINKADLAQASTKSPDSGHAVFVSAKTGAGFDDLLGELRSRLKRASGGGSALFTRERQREAVVSALSFLGKAQGLLSKRGLPELIAEELRQAQLALGRVRGLQETESVLDQIFGDFCIGK